nr:hypothetical protein [Gemmatimonadales bacterium]
MAAGFLALGAAVLLQAAATPAPAPPAPPRPPRAMVAPMALTMPGPRFHMPKIRAPRPPRWSRQDARHGPDSAQ